VLAPGLVPVPRIAYGEPDPLSDPLRPELGKKDGAGPGTGLPGARCLRFRERRRSPAVFGVDVQLVLEQEKAAPLEQGDPLTWCTLQLPALVVALPGRHGDEETAVAREHAMQLSQRRLLAVLVARGVDAVRAVVETDMLEGRDAERDVEPSVLERERPYIGDDVCGLGEIDGDATAAAASLVPCACEPVVEELDAFELLTLDHLSHEPRVRHLALVDPHGGLRIRLAPEHEPPCLLDEIVHEAEARVATVALQGKRIFVTGGAGLIATTLGRLLVDENEVIAYDNLHRDALSATDLAEHPNFTFVRGDVLDAEHVAEVATGATHIVHCAAIAGVDTVRESPVRTMRVNMIGTYNVLEAALGARDTLERIVDFSTSEVFGTHADNVHEGHVSTIGSVGEARWTYAVSKLAGEHLAHAYHDELNLPTVTVRPFNVYGPGQIGGGAIRAFIEAALAGRDLTIHGDGSQVRAWCYVDDMVRAVLLCLERPEAVGQSFNIGNDRSTVTILDLAQRIKRLTGCPGEIVFQPLHYADVEIRSPNVAQARELLGFEAEVDLDEGLERTIAWYRSRQLASA